MLELARTVSKCYQPPNIKLISKDILDVIHDQKMESNLSLIKKYSDIFLLLFLGDGATISRIPLMDILVSGNNLPVAVLELFDFQGHLSDGGEKDGTFICNIFLEHMRKIGPHKSITDVAMFDGDSNVQLAGELLKIHYPNISVMCGVEHTVALFFNDFSKIPVTNQMITAHKAISNLFGSGIYQKPHYIFKSKSYEFHNRNIGIFSGNDTRMVGCFIGIHRYLRIRKALLATFSSS